MPRRPSRAHRLVTAAAWPVGIALTSWSYMWRITPLHRRELAGTLEHDAPPALPNDASLEETQLDDAGVGPLFHRRYSALIMESDLLPEELLDRVASDLNKAAPTEFARFVKLLGEKGQMEKGDEYLVRMPGPWDGPVRVVDRTPSSFRLATLDGHLEAGQIEFRAQPEGEGIRFTIESWARSGDHLSRVMYQHLHMAKEVQFHMWTSFLERVVRIAGGRLRGGIDVETRMVDDEDGPALGDPTSRRILDQLHDKELNFELSSPRGDGWLSDDYCQPLPGEPPGDPVPGGSWEVAKGFMRDYEFADPSMIRAVYHPERPLEERDMLLEGRFYGLRFRFGVRVGGVVDETRAVDGRKVRVWGWNYRTLQGHLEMGQMDYEVWKWLDTGDVEFHTCRFSRRARVGNPLVRLGLRVFGRREQEKFARRACERMARLTAAAVEGREAEGVARVADEVAVRPGT